MTGAERSLLSFLEVPVLVGDPQGRTVYVNPAFEARFGQPAEAARGASLAQLFEGGGREAVLGAVAAVLAEWRSVRFRLRERGLGFTAIASPILAGGENVGVVILLQEEVEGLERLFHVQRMLQQSLEDLARALDADPPLPPALEGPLSRAREWCRALRRELQGRELEST